MRGVVVAVACVVLQVPAEADEKDDLKALVGKWLVTGYDLG